MTPTPHVPLPSDPARPPTHPRLPPTGRPQYGLPDGPCRPSLTYAFQQAKAAECEAAAERMAQPPSGRRGAARADLESQWAAQNAQPDKVRVHVLRFCVQNVGLLLGLQRDNRYGWVEVVDRTWCNLASMLLWGVPVPSTRCSSRRTHLPPLLHMTSIPQASPTAPNHPCAGPTSDPTGADDLPSQPPGGRGIRGLGNA